MSRIGKNPILIPEVVVVTIEGDVVVVSGKLGKISQKIPEGIIVKYEGDRLVLDRLSDSKVHKSMHGLSRVLLNNMVQGVSTGWVKELELVGVGYRVSNQGNVLDLALGYSHNIVLEIVPEVKVETISEKGKNPIVRLSCFDKQLLGEVAAKIRSFRKPEPYKGKGIKFVGEQLRKKAGKSA